MTGLRDLLKYCVMYDISSWKRHMYIMDPFFIWMEAAKVDSALHSNTYLQQRYFISLYGASKPSNIHRIPRGNNIYRKPDPTSLLNPPLSNKQCDIYTEENIDRHTSMAHLTTILAPRDRTKHTT
jgi:hypothetical protein